ncbi:hypothetical protein [Methylocapsa acidiphila]|nr:hypothetical protein [Methylocapsa acidiphila]
MMIKLPPPVHGLLGILRSEVGPEVLPSSSFLLKLSLGLFVVSEFAVKLPTHSFFGAIGIGITAAALLALFAALVAKLLDHDERLAQTLTALAFVGAIVALINFFFRFILVLGFGFIGDELPAQELASFLLFPIFLWNVILFASIYRRAFSLGLILSFALSIAYLLILFFWIPHFFK